MSLVYSVDGIVIKFSGTFAFDGTRIEILNISVVAKFSDAFHFQLRFICSLIRVPMTIKWGVVLVKVPLQSYIEFIDIQGLIL